MYLAEDLTDIIRSFRKCFFAYDLRVFHYSRALAQRGSNPWLHSDRLPLLLIASPFHDRGCIIEDDPQRFEVCGADAAAQHLRGYDVNAADVQEVWTAIACHTSPGIEERITSLARLLRLWPLMDFGGVDHNPWATDQERKIDNDIDKQKLEQKYPRLDIEKVLGDTVMKQGMDQATKAPAHSWAGIMVRAARENPEWTGINKAS